VHAGPQLLNSTYPDRFRRAAESSVRARGVDVILQDRIDHIPEAGAVDGVTTLNGKVLDADLVVSDSIPTSPWTHLELFLPQVSTRGPRPNTAFISSLGPDVLTDNGYVKVKPTLQLKGYPNIFAAGDVIDVPEQKQAAKAGHHATVVATNVLRYSEQQALQEYKGSTEMILLTNGKVRFHSSKFVGMWLFICQCSQNGGLGYFDILWGIIIGNWLAWLLKSRNLLVPRARSKAGY
jgi:apoptosis-inducing factor 2